MKIAVVGASGFIGSRVVEMLHLERSAEIRPIVRRASGLVRAARFDLSGRVADARDETALRSALAGCEVVVHAVAGDLAMIADTLTPVYAASAAAGVRRLIYLSSTSVHGQAPAAGTDERSPLSDDQPLPYNVAKIRAERTLFALRSEGAMELVVLRPGIVHGPRSRWTAGWADDLLAGRAYLVGDGSGVCNAIYVDNLVHAIRLAAQAPAAAVDGQAFIVGDQESITWAELYRPIALALGFDLDGVPRVSFDPTTPTRSDWWQRLNVSKETRSARVFLSLFPERLRYSVYSALGAWRNFQTAPSIAHGPRAPQQPPVKGPVPTREMALLHACRYKLPSTKAESGLGYRAPVSFGEACRRSVGWLAFAGYPIVERDLASSGRESSTRVELGR